MLVGCPVTWELKKQWIVALSSIEAEYVALLEAMKQALYLTRFLKDLGFDHLNRVRIPCDNNEARKLAKNPVFHNRIKHIDVRHHHERSPQKWRFKHGVHIH